MRRTTFRRKFLARCSTTKPSECWLWQGALNAQGYGTARYGKTTLAHRASYEFFVGPIPDGMTIDHVCFTPSCVNPAHLRPMTLVENSRRQRSTLKTECAAGHPFTPENTYLRTGRSQGRRQCRKCNAEAARRYAAKRKAA